MVTNHLHRGRPWILPLLALLVGILSVPSAAQGPTAGELAEARQRFTEALKKPGAGERIAGIHHLVVKGWVETFPWLQEALAQTRVSRDRLHRRCQELGRLIDEKTTFREHVRRRSPRSTVAELQKEFGAAKGMLERDEKVIRALNRGLGKLFVRLPHPAKAKIIAGFERELKGSLQVDKLAAGAETLGFLTGPGAVAILAGLVEHRKPAVRIAALDALARQGDPAAGKAVAGTLEDPFWQVQAAAVKALTALADRAAVTALIAALGRNEGRILQDIIDALKKLTGRNFRDNHTLWVKWWRENREEYGRPGKGKSGLPGALPPSRPPVPRAGGRPVPGRRGGGTTFYGIHTRSKRIIYILDISNSMNFPLGDRYSPPRRGLRPAPVGKRKIDQAIKELTSSITALPPDATFNIVFYHHEVNRWRRKQIQATAANKKRAIDWAHKVVASGTTNIFDALEEAFKLAGRGSFDFYYPVAADTFFLLSDGRANRGRLVDGNAIRDEVRRLNRTQRVVIHTIALGSDADVEFMRGLARDTGGQFVQYGSRGRVGRPR